MATQPQIDIIRANLLGLPEEITDVVIGTIVGSSRSLHDAAIALAESAASLAVSDSESIRLGPLSIGGERTTEYWLRIKDNLVSRQLTNNGVIVDPERPSGRSSGYAAIVSGNDIPARTVEGQFTNNGVGY